MKATARIASALSAFVAVAGFSLASPGQVLPQKGLSIAALQELPVPGLYVHEKVFRDPPEDLQAAIFSELHKLRENKGFLYHISESYNRDGSVNDTEDTYTFSIDCASYYLAVHLMTGRFAGTLIAYSAPDHMLVVYNHAKQNFTSGKREIVIDLPLLQIFGHVVSLQNWKAEPMAKMDYEVDVGLPGDKTVFLDLEEGRIAAPQCGPKPVLIDLAHGILNEGGRQIRFTPTPAAMAFARGPLIRKTGLSLH